MLTKPRILLQLEGAALFVLILYLYHATGATWGWFCLLFLWPDLFMVGYLANPKVGSALYNLSHFALLPAMMAGSGLMLHKVGMVSFALIWAAHIEWDRAIGYGFKYPTFFKDTHLQRISQAG